MPMDLKDIKALSAMTALNEMFKGKHFSICTVNECATLFGVVPDRECMEILRPLHCVDYAAMPRELYTQLPGLVQQALQGTPVYQFEMKMQQPDATFALEQKPSFLRRLLSHGS